MVSPIYTASPFPNFQSRNSYVKKITVYFLAIFVNLTCKIEKFELEVVRGGILGTGFSFQGSHYHLREIIAKRVTLISLKTVLLIGRTD